MLIKSNIHFLVLVTLRCCICCDSNDFQVFITTKVTILILLVDIVTKFIAIIQSCHLHFIVIDCQIIELFKALL